jgi:hypothetical protein
MEILANISGGPIKLGLLSRAKIATYCSMNIIIKQNEVSSVLNKNGSSFIKNEPLFINQ